MIFPVVMYGCESWTIKKTERWRIDVFELCWRRLLRVPWTARRSNQSILKEISPGCSLEGLMLKLKLILWPPDAKNWFIWKYPYAGKDWRWDSVQFSCSVMSEPLRPHGQQHARPPCPSPTPRVYSNLCPLSRWCHPTISSPATPSPFAFNLSNHQGVFHWVSSAHQVAKVLEFQLQHQSFQWTPRTDLL